MRSTLKPAASSLRVSLTSPVTGAAQTLDVHHVAPAVNERSNQGMCGQLAVRADRLDHKRAVDLVAAAIFGEVGVANWLATLHRDQQVVELQRWLAREAFGLGGFGAVPKHLAGVLLAFGVAQRVAHSGRVHHLPM